MSRFAAKLLLTVIIASHRSRYDMCSAHAPVYIGVRVVAHGERVRASVDDAVERVDDGDAVVQSQQAGARLAEQLDHDGHFHGARGVKRDVGLNQQLVASVESAKRHRRVRPARANQLLDCGACLAAIKRDRRDRSGWRQRDERRGDEEASHAHPRILARPAAVLCHIVPMRWLRAALLLSTAWTSAACFQMTTIVRVKGDASGTIDQRLVFSPAALAQMRQLAMLGGSSGRPIDPISEDQARADAASLGPGASLVSSAPIDDATGRGRASVYAFSDINHLRINPRPAAPGGLTVHADGIDSTGKAITFTLAHQENGNALLTIMVPLPELPAGGLPSRDGAGSAQQLAMVKQMFAGARVTIAVEPAGTLVRTSSPFVEGSRVTLLDVNLDQLLQDDTLLARIQAAKSAGELKAILQEAPGLKINFERAITIEFTPAS